MKTFTLFLLSCLITVFTVTSAHAEKADRNKPMNIEADALKHDDQQQLTTFTGKVQMTKGSLVLKAHRMEVRQDNQGNQVAKLWSEAGERVFFRQKREKTHLMNGRASRPIFTARFAYEWKLSMGHHCVMYMY